MKTSFTSIAKVAGSLALMAASSAAIASVSNTVHNLSVTGEGSHMTGANGTTEICIFCHTPHGGNQAVNAPIWNRSVSSTGVYTRFSSLGRITFDAEEAPVGGVSIACLSCHDGTQARNAVINGPGSGPNSNTVTTDAGTATWLDGTEASTAYLSALAASDNGTLSGDLIYLGTDLRNDHPISMQYGGGGYTIAVGAGTGVGTATNDPDFASFQAAGSGGYGATAANHAPTTSTNPPAVVPTGIATGSVNFNTKSQMFYVDTGTPGYQATDFPLYTRTDGANSPGAEPMVECGTCHDPHSSNVTFLRLPGGNTGSQVCLTCHAK
ncbi:MAG TPA: cytochrome c3 family protein [Gallionella sp.]|nr:cytochrome c3 family protein [Gallionella sp.]